MGTIQKQNNLIRKFLQARLTKDEKKDFTNKLHYIIQKRKS
jgi:hypothetical protein